MTRFHPAAMGALARDAARAAEARGFEGWIQQPWEYRGALLALVWDGTGPMSRGRFFIAATPAGTTVVADDLLAVQQETRRQLEIEDRALEPDPEPEALVLAVEG